MFELDIEMLKEQGLQLVDSAKKTAQDLADKGKNKLDLLNQQARLSKAQRQLGALVYSLHKAGEENPALVEKYIDAVAEVEKAIEEIKANMTDDERAEVEAQEAAEKAQAEATAKQLEGLMVKITAKAGEGGRLFGAVTAKEISEALAEQHQVEIAKTKLVLDEPIKACGGYQIRAKLGYEVTGTVNVMVTEEQ